MKIIDYEKSNFYLPISAVFLFAIGIVYGVKTCRLDRSDFIPTLVVAVVFLFAICYHCVYDWHFYYIDETGIAFSSFFGLLNQRFGWDEFSCLVISTIQGGPRTRSYNGLILTKLNAEELPNAKHPKESFWYWQRYKTTIMFKLTSNRYEYIRQFCDLPLIDNR